MVILKYYRSTRKTQEKASQNRCMEYLVSTDTTGRRKRCTVEKSALVVSLYQCVCRKRGTNITSLQDGPKK